MTKGTASASCVGNPGSDGLSPLKLGLNVNHLTWRTDQEPDWMVIRPNYTSPGGVELRSIFGMRLKTLRSPTSPVYTFPTAEDIGGFLGVGGPLRNLTASGTNLTFSGQAIGTVAPGVNFETSWPNFVSTYQTDLFTGPSEKMLINLKRLRALGFDRFDIMFSMCYINTNFNASAVPLELAFYKGGYPTPSVITGSQTDWSFPGGTEINREVLYSRRVKNVNTLATKDDMMLMELSLVRRQLIFYPIA